MPGRIPERLLGATPSRARGDPLPSALERGLATRHLPALDGLRAVAAYLVVLYHFAWRWVPGGLGVLGFFVLSGFLITWLLLQEVDRRGTVSLRRFYARRALRILPAYYVYAAGLLGLLLLTGRRIVWGQTIASLFYVNDYYQAIAGDPNTGWSHTWSLGVEEQFYLLAPAAFLLLRKRRSLAGALAAGVACVWVHRWTLVVAGVSQGYIYEAFDARADHLMIGCLLAVALHDGIGARLWRVACGHPALPAATLAALALSSALGVLLGSRYRDPIGFVVDPLLVALLMVQLLALAEVAPWSWLNHPAVRFLGRISYSIYLYQQVVPSLAGALFRGRPFAVVLGAEIMGVTLVASLSYFVVERPFLAFKHRVDPRSPGAAAVARPEPDGRGPRGGAAGL